MGVFIIKLIANSTRRFTAGLNYADSKYTGSVKTDMKK
ncbi:hypothetical protein imdm_680 [gamma proteobacterium IMCC2047]|nr:hypothetical protein imdm_680 [gamma proteobacterium IMCC2047]